MRPLLGIDPSLSHTAGHWALTPESIGVENTFAIKSEPKYYASRIARLWDLRRRVFDCIQPHTAEHGPGDAFVEGYSFGARNEREKLGEWGGVLRLVLLDLGWDIVEVPPSTLKKFTTGKGHAEKDGMRMEVLKRWGYESTDNNDCDAYALLHLGRAWQRWSAGEHVTKDVADVCAKLVVMRADARVEVPAKRTRKAANGR